MKNEPLYKNLISTRSFLFFAVLFGAALLIVWMVSEPTKSQFQANYPIQNKERKSEYPSTEKIAKVFGNFLIDDRLEKKVTEVIEFQKIQLGPSGSCTVEYHDGRSIRLEGEGEFLCCRDGTKILNIWKGKISFGKYKQGYKLYLPVATLAIRGTVIHLDSQLSVAKCWVENGVVEWKANFTNDSGILSANQGVIISDRGIKLLENSPLIENQKKIASTALNKIFDTPASSGKEISTASEIDTSQEKRPNAISPTFQNEQLEEYMKKK
ncbi:MAG: hypothetical protein HQM08_01150 [Candidatus Riflebacteria bacterium]|nr:hypothetical protein [Candidatus Riflebacteria bacterium]